ncbi:MAG TPA: cyclase family protein [Terriglobia bacterium]|nr:cyclase family protein [Terriglobia bacterium]
MDDQLSSGLRDGKLRLVDLTHTLDGGSPYWPEDRPGSPFHTSAATTYQRDGNFTRNLSMPEHFGTHMDAPVHFDPKGESVDRIPVERFLAPGVVIDVSPATKLNADYRVTVKDIGFWTEHYGAVPPGAVVFFQTGWAARWPSQEKYMNADADGVLHFPGLSLEAARYLLDHAQPVGIGIDTASVDFGPSTDCPVHHVTMPAGIYHLENVANLDQLPATGFSVIALPLKIAGGSGSPARVIALVTTES